MECIHLIGHLVDLNKNSAQIDFQLKTIIRFIMNEIIYSMQPYRFALSKGNTLKNHHKTRNELKSTN